MNVDYLELENFITNTLKKCKIVKTKIQNEARKNWINKEIINEINQRNMLWTEIKKNPNDESLRSDFIYRRNFVSKLIQETKDTYHYNQFIKYVNKPKKMWNLINTLANNNTKRNCAPSKLLVNSITVTDPKEICNTFNTYFATIGPKLADEIIQIFGNPSAALPSKPTDTVGLTTFDQCTTLEISKIIDNLNPLCSTGIDGINTKSIKCIKNLIVDSMCKCFNKLLNDGEFPNSLKIAKVSPIYKSGLTSEPGNYRPISVLPVISKILEKILHNRLEKYLKSINFITERQYGFRPRSNTLTATADLVTKIKYSIDSKNTVVGVFIDLKKAFDTVSHKLLLQKLEAINITGTALKMFDSYLTIESR
ncbi:unnamed protein product [Euphydryas editha]|uniref:Reverse transcriptase domain-containing protein n=1 Tax=Euphydryas editha TaxID=104508 RepID=A0AAU9TL46_EUPED|nr:unnamed protein product [Euphydryas editha]